MLEPEVVEPEVVVAVQPPLRGRMVEGPSCAGRCLRSASAGAAGITDDTWDDLEEALLRADVGVGVTTDLLDGLRTRVKDKELTEPDELLDALRAEMKERLDGRRPRAALRAGGAGQPERVAVRRRQRRRQDHDDRQGRRASSRPTAGAVLLAAGDTFRAAAAEQLDDVGRARRRRHRARQRGRRPERRRLRRRRARVVAADYDLVLADTAGRLHTKSNLMEELRKVRRVAEKGAGRVTEVLLVIDATTGQNGLAQAREFGEATEVTGVVLTKLDGSAKGGIVFAIETELGIPVKLVGLGETIGDLVPFDPDEFVDALFDE